MALSDGTASREQVLQAERRLRERRASLERAAALSAARVTGEGAWDDGSGTVWRYAVLDGAEARIERCETRAARLAVPAAIRGLPVVALAPDACAWLPDVEEIACPDSLLAIGFCAFRGNARLERIALPANLGAFDSDWLRGCVRLAHLALPGRLAKLDASIFDLPALRTLAVGAGTEDVEPGAFAKSALEGVEVDPANLCMATDGRALYRRDGSVLLALAVPGASYRIADGCRVVAKKAFGSLACVERVEAPEGLEVLEPFAFARTGLVSFAAPESLRRIGEKAFFGCGALREVSLTEGLVSVGAHAFSQTALGELRLPASVEELGHPLAARCGLVFAGPDATFSLAGGPSARLALDEAGGLYREDAEGRRFVRLMDPEARRYAVRPGTVAVEEGAFERHARIAEIDFPAGLVAIGRAACKGCRALVRADLPDGVRSIGDEAFLDTNLARLRVPASLEHLGANALVTNGAHHGTEEPSLRAVEADAANPRFYTEAGLLLERKADGNARVVLCTGAEEVVRIPPEVDEIAPYAFNDVRGIRELHLSDRIARVGIRGLGADGPIELVAIDLEQPIAGRERFEIRFPATDRGTQQQMLALGMLDRVDVAALFERYDNAIVNASSFDAQSEHGLGAYEQAKRITERLLDPVFLTPVNRSLCDKVLRSGLEDLCVDIARHDDLRVFDALFDLGYLDADTVNGVIDRVGALQDAAMTAYLLEAKRLRFGQAAFDFEL